MDTGKGTAALEKAFDLLEAIGLASEGLDTQQLAMQVGLPRSTLYRLLGLLIEPRAFIPACSRGPENGDAYPKKRASDSAIEHEDEISGQRSGQPAIVCAYLENHL